MFVEQDRVLERSGHLWKLQESAGTKLSFRKDLGDLRWEAEGAGKREGGLEVDPKKSKF